MTQRTSLHDAVATRVRKSDHEYVSEFSPLIPPAVGPSVSRQEQAVLLRSHASPDLLFAPRIDRAASLRHAVGSGGT